MTDASPSAPPPSYTSPADTDSLNAAGFTARPVYGAWWAPVLVAQGPQLGLGVREDPAWQRARAVFERVHAASAAAAAK